MESHFGIPIGATGVGFVGMRLGFEFGSSSSVHFGIRLERKLLVGMNWLVRTGHNYSLILESVFRIWNPSSLFCCSTIKS